MTHDASAPEPEPGDGAIVLIGLMGAGKSSVGRRLAKHLGLAFVDTDDEIVKAAGCSVSDIFEIYGENAFRDVERRVIARLLREGRCVIATGGGAFMDPESRRRIAAGGISVWLRAELDVLLERTSRRDTRPLLRHADPRAVLASLMQQRYPVYAEADLVVDSDATSIDATVRRVIDALGERGLIASRSVEPS